MLSAMRICLIHNKPYYWVTDDRKYRKIYDNAQRLEKYIGAAYKEVCDEDAARYELISFFKTFQKCGPDKRLFISGRPGGYYSFLINLMAVRNALVSGKYALACHELKTLFDYEPILQERIYYPLCSLYEDYIKNVYKTPNI